MDHRFVDTNSAYERQTGLVDAVGKTAREMVPDIEESWHSLYAEVADSGTPRRFELHSLALGRWFDVFVAPFGEGSSRIALLFSDVTAKKRAELELEARAQEHSRMIAIFQALFDNAPGAIWAKDAEGRLLLTNDHLERLLGVPRAQLRGKSGYDLFPTVLADAIRDHDARAAAGEVLHAEETVPTPQGVRTYLSNKFPVRGTAEMPAVVAGVSIDITERKRAEEQLHRSEERLRTVLETNVIGVMAWNATGGITFANHAVLRMLGASREEVEAGGLDWTLLTPPARAGLGADFLEVVRGGGTAAPYEKSLFRKDGSRVPVLIACAAFPDDPTSGVAFVVDLTEQKRTQSALEERIAFEERLVGIVGHDLRNPLSTAKLQLALMLRAADLPAPTRQRLQRLADVLGRMERIVADLLDLARIRAGKGLPIQPTPLSLTELCRHLVDEAEALFPDATFVVEGQGQVMGAWDRDRLSQLLMNLLTNAVKHGARDRPIHVRIASEGDRATVSVHNFGGAISPNRLETLFDPYRQGEDANAATGLGLGLYIVKEIARAHGGDVRVESSERDGTTFTLTVPLAHGEEAPANDA